MTKQPGRATATPRDPRGAPRDGDPPAAGGPGRCAWCRRPLPPAARTGRPRRFCKQGCRQAHHVAAKRASELRLGEDELVLARHELDALRDAVYVLQCAVDDVERDLATTTRPSNAELRDALRWLLEAARDVVHADLVDSPDRP